MDIYYKLPHDIQSKICFYFRHPIAEALHKYPWIIPEIKYNWSPPPTTKKRLAYAYCLYRRRGYGGGGGRKRCGCIWYEQHQLCCNDVPEEELEFWDPVIRTTPLQQALLKMRLMTNLKSHTWIVI